ncbi:hypothetical protein J4207_03380 [Candidatus Woesearchaeota archaeon]|nr:hypothetical protein [Candidatus Woesearchaeota archaeon]
MVMIGVDAVTIDRIPATRVPLEDMPIEEESRTSRSQLLLCTATLIAIFGISTGVDGCRYKPLTEIVRTAEPDNSQYMSQLLYARK